MLDGRRAAARPGGRRRRHEYGRIARHSSGQGIPDGERLVDAAAALPSAVVRLIEARLWSRVVGDCGSIRTTSRPLPARARCQDWRRPCRRRRWPPHRESVLSTGRPAAISASSASGLLRRGIGQHFHRCRGDKHVVLDADADVPQGASAHLGAGGCSSRARRSAPCRVAADATRRRSCSRRRRARPCPASGRCGACRTSCSSRLQHFSTLPRHSLRSIKPCARTRSAASCGAFQCRFWFDRRDRRPVRGQHDLVDVLLRRLNLPLTGKVRVMSEA